MIYTPSFWAIARMVMLFGPCVTDLTRREIPNRLTSVIVVFALASGLNRAGPAGGMSALEGLFVAGFFFFALYLFGGLGGGDVKLAGALGALVGSHSAFYFILFAWMWVGLWAVADLARRRQYDLFLAPRNALHVAREERRLVPMAPALSLGAISVDAFTCLKL